MKKILVFELVECFYGVEVVENVYKGVGNLIIEGELFEGIFEVMILCVEFGGELFIVMIFCVVGLNLNVVVVKDVVVCGVVKVDWNVVDMSFFVKENVILII